MRLSTRLILLLAIALSVVMMVSSLITLRQRESALLRAAHDEARAHALTLKIALEEDYRVGRSLDAQILINRLRDNTGILSVVLFDAGGNIAAISKTLPPAQFEDSDEARKVIASGKNLEIERRSLGKDNLSIIMPLHVRDKCIGAIEIVLEIGFVKADITRARFHNLVVSLFLVLAVLCVVTAVTRYSLIHPIQELIQGAAAVGRGDLKYRVPVKSAYGELAILANEFNRTADRLEEQRNALLRESDQKLDLERKLRHNEKLALTGRLAAGVAHEVGAPLQVISGRAEKLLQNPEIGMEARQRYLTIILRQTERITRIVRNLLNLSRPYNVLPRTVSLTGLLRETIDLVETMAEAANVRIEMAGSEDVLLQADPELVQQMLLNICRNGIQAVGSDGKIIVDWKSGAARKGSAEFAAIRIMDSGPGIAEEHFPVLFDLFFTTKEVGQGTGLGLPISRHIVEEHGGWIEAANRREGGAVFTIYLPQAVSASANKPGSEGGDRE